MQKHIFICITFFALSFFTSCFNFTEEITFNKNGSGTFTRTVDMSDMISALSTFVPDSGKNLINIDKELNIEDIKSSFKNIEGISNITSSLDEMGIVALSFDFKNIDALNKAILTNTSADMTSQLNKTNDRYTLKKHSIARKLLASGNSKILDNFNLPNNNEMLELFNPPSYRLIYHLPSKAKKITTTEKNAKVSQDGQTVCIELNLMDLIMGTQKEMLNHEIQF